MKGCVKKRGKKVGNKKKTDQGGGGGAGAICRNPRTLYLHDNTRSLPRLLTVDPFVKELLYVFARDRGLLETINNHGCFDSPKEAFVFDYDTVLS